MLLLNKSTIQNFYSIDDCMHAVTEAFRLFSDGKVNVPLRTQIVKSDNKSTFLCMPAFCEKNNSASVKVLNMFPDNISRGLASINAQVLNIDAETGAINCLMDGNYVTQLRTGAASGVAFKFLAKQNCHKGALIGAGGQAATQLEAMLIARDLDEVQVSDYDFKRAKDFADQMNEELAKYRTKIVAVSSANEAVSEADLIISVTTSKTPVYDGSLVKAGATVSGVGSYQPQMQETPLELLQRAAKIYFDSKEAVLAEAGDLLQPLQKNQITQTNFIGELGKVISGELTGRSNDEEIIFFKTVGIAAQDLMTAKSIYEKARANQKGLEWE
ncbi:ornithine cyclodeaminase family protein [Xylocopilactobacillus apicola]|uniref:Ornithine cyclodeaminase n=1 Tax=Xylocopilactobacillus apicola TaxID=2932184 RepID=A0AAU9DG62_9LACO|nr:ornithine cyclodeaminase family protein [Xylocopilactobacillus apicola]BDR58935.1 ornithine cyclodeaminase [Xylocopilactobacillus apicola]